MGKWLGESWDHLNAKFPNDYRPWLHYEHSTYILCRGARDHWPLGTTPLAYLMEQVLETMRLLPLVSIIAGGIAMFLGVNVARNAFFGTMLRFGFR